MELEDGAIQTSKSLKWAVFVLDCTDVYSTILNCSEFNLTSLDSSLSHSKQFVPELDLYSSSF